jgi:hypothetical protein
MRFVGRALPDPVLDAKTISLYREQLARDGTVERLLARFVVAPARAFLHIDPFRLMLVSVLQLVWSASAVGQIAKLPW